MIYSFFPDADTTLYEGTPGLPDVNMRYTNTGLDEILEVRKIVSSSNTSATYISRALVKFDIDFKKVAGGANWSDVTPKAYLNLYTTEISQVDSNLAPICHPVSESWDEGLGRENNLPQTLTGASWINKRGDGATGTAWSTGSVGLADDETPGAVHGGGGTWHNGISSTDELTTSTKDLRFDATTAVAAWSESVYHNFGFVVKMKDVDESTAESYSLKFFSRQTHTIYPPRLEVCWNDKVYNTGSLTELNMGDTEAVFFYLKNNKGAYKRGSKIRFWSAGREKYPVKTNGTTSAELAIRHVPEDKACYSVIDAKTNETVIPYDSTYTALSCDATKGNYFEIYSDSLFEERLYKLQIRYNSGSAFSPNYSYYDIKDLFKITR